MLMRRLRNSVLLGAGALATVTTAGCFGRFPLVSAVYDFNRGLGNKVVRTLAMWVMILIPVYEVAAIADILVFNLIEFWSGGTAVAEVQTLPDGRRLEIARVSPDVLRIRLVPTQSSGRPEEVELVKVSDRAGYVRRVSGPIVATVEQTAGGRVVSRETRP